MNCRYFFKWLRWFTLAHPWDESLSMANTNTMTILKLLFLCLQFVPLIAAITWANQENGAENRYSVRKVRFLSSIWRCWFQEVLNSLRFPQPHRESMELCSHLGWQNWFLLILTWMFVGGLGRVRLEGLGVDLSSDLQSIFHSRWICQLPILISLSLNPKCWAFYQNCASCCVSSDIGQLICDLRIL